MVLSCESLEQMHQELLALIGLARAYPAHAKQAARQD